MIFHTLDRATPQACRALAGRLAPATGWAAAMLVGAGLAVGLVLAPTLAGHDDSVRILVIQRPAAWIGFAIYLAIGGLAIATLARGSRVAPLVASSLAPTGVLFVFLALWTEALWRKPAQGVWWAWNAESVSLLLLLFLYAGFIAMKSMIDDPRRGDRAASLLAILGLANLPVLYFSIRWWDVLRHDNRYLQADELGTPLAAAAFLVASGFALYAAHAAMKRLRCLVAEREALAHSLLALTERAA